MSVPRGARIRHRGSGVDIRQTRRWAADDRVTTGVPRTPACGRRRFAAALWAATDRQAELLMTMAVQQALARPRRARRTRCCASGGTSAGRCSTTWCWSCMGGIRSLERARRGPRLPRARPPRAGQAGAADVRRTAPTTWTSAGTGGGWPSRSTASSTRGRPTSSATRSRHNRLAIDGDTVLRLPVLGVCGWSPTRSSTRSARLAWPRAGVAGPPDPGCAGRHTTWSPGQPPRMTSPGGTPDVIRPGRRGSHLV